MEGVGVQGPRVAGMPSTVLVVSNHGEIVGGGEISLLTLLKGLVSSRWAPTVVVPVEGRVAGRCRALGIATHVIPLPPLRRPGPAMLHTIAALRRLVLDVGACLVHANGSRAMFYAGLAGRLTGRPAIWHVRILEPDPWLDWLLVRLARRTIAISEAVRSRLAPWPRAFQRCVVVPNGLDLEEFASRGDAATFRKSLGLGPGDQIIGTVGRLVRFKGHNYLLEAFARLRQDRPNLRLLIVGEGPERCALERKAQVLGIAREILLTGHREDVADLLAIMEVFVLPSLAEHFGRVLLEAMAMERPVIATAAGGVPEVVEENITGLLVSPGDSTALANAIAALLDDPPRARTMGAAGRERVAKHFSMQACAQKTQEVYADALASREGP